MRSPRVGRAAPSQVLAGLRVILFGLNRAPRVVGALDALEGASRRGADLVYVDGGSRDRSIDAARAHRAGARVVGSLAEALDGNGEGFDGSPTLIACATLRVDVDWRCLATLARSAARSDGGTLHSARLVAADGTTTDLAPAPPSTVGPSTGSTGSPGLPAVWLARPCDARAALAGTFDGRVRRRVDAVAQLVDSGSAAAEPR